MESTPEQRRRLVNKVLIVSGLSALLVFAVYVIYLKRTPRHYFIPKGFHGWVTIKYEKKGAPALPLKDGAYQIVIPASGILETSTKLEEGWARDEHFWVDSTGVPSPIPKHVSENGADKRFIHSQGEYAMDYSPLFPFIRDGEDSTLWDGGKISRKDTFFNVRSGRKIIEHFWVSDQAEPFFYVHDSLPKGANIW